MIAKAQRLSIGSPRVDASRLLDSHDHDHDHDRDRDRDHDSDGDYLASLDGVIETTLMDTSADPRRASLSDAVGQQPMRLSGHSGLDGSVFDEMMLANDLQLDDMSVEVLMSTFTDGPGTII